MTDYAWPSGVPIYSATFWLVDGVRVFRSPLSGTVRTEKVHPPYWEGSLSFVNLTSAQGQKLEAALWKIQGAVNRIYVPMKDYTRQGAGGGTPRVQGGSQTGLSLVTDGWPSSTLVLKEGDRFSVDGQAFAVASDVTSSGGGVATITLANDIRTAPGDNELLEIDTPVVRCILKSKVGLPAEPGKFKSGQIEFEEAVPE